MTVRASVDVGIQDVSIRGWARYQHRATSHLPFIFLGTVPLHLLVPIRPSGGPQTAQGDVRRIPPGQPMALATPEQETPRCARAPQKEEETECENAENRDDRHKGEHSDLPPPARYVTLSGWLLHRIQPPTMEDEGDEGHARREGAPDGPLQRNPGRHANPI